MEENVKISAVMAAVTAYLEEEAMAMAQSAVEPEVPVAPVAPANLWGISGRQSQMQFRNLMQLKAFHGLRR